MQAAPHSPFWEEPLAHAQQGPGKGLVHGPPVPERMRAFRSDQRWRRITRRPKSLGSCPFDGSVVLAREEDWRGSGRLCAEKSRRAVSDRKVNQGAPGPVASIMCS